ncbi:MAG: hypothetical protein IKV00_01975 [Clostridia bacterium]|nr:hypothetical protein [Clostridia bacterium]
MGYFSELDYLQKNREYLSYHGFEDQLLYRYENLKILYWELLDEGAPACGDDRFTTDDYRYAPLAFFTTLTDVYRAMEIAKEDLALKCGIMVAEDQPEEEPNPDQLSLFEFVLLPALWQTAVAA